MTDFLTGLFIAGLAVGTVIWVRLLAALFSALEIRHPEKYEAMGYPNIYALNSWPTNKATVRFLAHREYLALGDAALTKRCNVIRLYFPFSVFWCFSLLLGLYLGLV